MFSSSMCSGKIRGLEQEMPHLRAGNFGTMHDSNTATNFCSCFIICQFLNGCAVLAQQALFVRSAGKLSMHARMFFSIRARAYLHEEVDFRLRPDAGLLLPSRQLGHKI